MGTDTAFLDRMHCYNPGWEIPKFRPEHFTDDYGFITDYLAGFIRELSSDDFGIVDMDGAELRSKKSKQKDVSPVSITKLTPIQMPNVDMNQLKQGRGAFTKNEWIDVLLRSTGMEPDELSYREKWLLLTRMLPLVENNINLCELGPRSTGKSHLYKEISPNSILVSGGQTTVANLFYNMGKRTMNRIIPAALILV